MINDGVGRRAAETRTSWQTVEEADGCLEGHWEKWAGRRRQRETYARMFISRQIVKGDEDPRRQKDG